MTAYNVSNATVKTRREAVKTLRILLDGHMPRKQALREVSKQLKEMRLPHSTRTIYYWAKEFGISTL